MTQLRPYQEAAREAIEHEWASGKKRTLLVLPTGTGKTVVFSKVAEDQVRAGNRVLILAHRGELLDQAADKLYRMTGLKSSIEKADQTALGTWNRVTVGSVQSLQRENRLDRFDPNYYGTIIIDEAHHAITDGYRRIIDHFSDANVLGVTATPDR
ncbi:DEAD/DEAH box helicase family protein, partial [Galactobacillus timonensis]|uniref:DEAD/DEAH box helicase family protein n=1 Tax=Galactobacillus timonensis TaxID=2041840 RepID=UPI00108382F7